jgi:hypothetical protein
MLGEAMGARVRHAVGHERGDGHDLGSGKIKSDLLRPDEQLENDDVRRPEQEREARHGEEGP